MVALQLSLVACLTWCVAEALSLVHLEDVSRTSCPLGLPKRAALVYHGEYYRRREEVAKHAREAIGTDLNGTTGTYLDGDLEKPIICSNYFESAANIRENIIQPLEDCGTELVTFFHSYVDSLRPCRDEKLVRALAPHKHRFDSSLLPRIVDSYIEALRLAQPELSNLTIDTVILLRFDVIYRRKITELPLAWNAVNFAFRGLRARWENEGRVSDLFLAFPASYTESVIQALDSCEQVGHDMFRPLSREIGGDAIHFVDPGNRGSNPFHETDAWLGTNRNCGDNATACT